MLVRVRPYLRAWSSLALTRPLTIADWLKLAVVLLVAGTIYCQFYCLLALQHMHGASMPVWSSVVRAGVDIVPPLAAFELAKRVLLRGRLWQWLLVILIFAAALGVAVAVRSSLSIMSAGLSPRRMAVDRLPFMLLAATALAYFHLGPRFGTGQADWRRVSDEPDRMPPPAAITWVKAAGNYVEVHAHGRTRLFRITLRETADKLPLAQFVQIHRSVIINRDRVARRNGRKSVEMTDGTMFPIGDAYRSNLNGR
jgi:hypothetical protein